MPTSPDDIRRWLREAQAQHATHLIVACDTFDYDDYPVYVTPGENIQRRFSQYNGPNMQRVQEVYALHLDLESQIREPRAMHLENPPTHREPLIVETPTTLSRVIAQVRREAEEANPPTELFQTLTAFNRAREPEEVFEREPRPPRRPRRDIMTLATRVIELLVEEPWLSAYAIAVRLQDKPSSVSSLLVKLCRESGPLVREAGRGRRGGYGYALKPGWVPPEPPGPRGDVKSRYELLLKDWL